MIDLEHSPLGGSGAKRWLACAGSFLLHRELLMNGEFEETRSAYADKGTAAHELGARCLTEEREPWEFVGDTFSGYKVGYGEGQIDPDAVAIYVNECESLWPRDGKGTVLIEKTLHRPDTHPYLKGTIDFGRWTPKRMSLRDYKNGEGVGVSAGNNPQMLYYAFLVALEHPWLTDGPKDLPVDLGIVQPNFYGHFEPADVWHTTLGHVTAWGHDLLVPRMKQLSVDQDIELADFVSGDHCQFCPVMLECPKLQQSYRTYATATEFVEMLTDQELSEFYRIKDDARRFMTAMEATIKARLIGGSAITTAKLVSTRTSRQWKPDAETALTAAFGDKAYDRKILSPAQVEKISSRGKALALEFGFMPEAVGLSVASIDDPRPAAKPPSNADTFAAFAVSSDLEGF